VRAYARRRIPLDVANGNQFTLAVMQSLKRLLGAEVAAEIDLWAENRASIIREPIEEQYRDAELMLKGLIEQKIMRQYRSSKKGMARALDLILPVAALVLGAMLSFSISGERIKLPCGLRPDIIAMTLVAFFGAGSASYVVFRRSWSSKSAEREVEEARVARQISLVEEKLKGLEILRKADLDTLVRQGAKETRK
jgi:hypothetical protein